MIISCTKKMQEELGIKPTLLQVENPLFSWHANILRVNRKKTIVVVNDACRYHVILYGVKAKELKNIKEFIISAMRQTFLNDGMNSETIEQYLHKFGEILFSKTQNRTMVARLNKGCEAAEIFRDFYIEEHVVQFLVSKKVNRFTIIDCDGEYKHPHELFYEQLSDSFHFPAIKCRALELKVIMNLENFNVWRKVVVPLNFTFSELHKVMQVIFDWKEYHLHDFIILDGDKPFIHIVESEEDIEYQGTIPMIVGKNIKIEDYLPEYKVVNYRYDFGDGWEHIMKVENVISDYDKIYAYCLDGKGDSPPEDVGGEGGYEEFVEVMNDPTREEYEHMKLWAESQPYKSFDIESVNRRLKYLF